MTTRLDALSVRESDGKSYFSRIGVAFPAKEGPGWTVLLDAMPAPTDGQFKILLREPLPKDGDRARSAGNDRRDASERSSRQPRYSDQLDDQMPF